MHLFFNYLFAPSRDSVGVLMMLPCFIMQVTPCVATAPGATRRPSSGVTCRGLVVAGPCLRLAELDKARPPYFDDTVRVVPLQDESSGRDFRERRPPPFAGPSSRYQGRGGFREDRGRGVYRGRGFRGAPRGGRYESGVQQRLSIPYRGGHDAGYRRKYADYEQSDQPFKRQR